MKLSEPRSIKWHRKIENGFKSEQQENTKGRGGSRSSSFAVLESFVKLPALKIHWINEKKIRFAFADASALK